MLKGTHTSFVATADARCDECRDEIVKHLICEATTVLSVTIPTALTIIIASRAAVISPKIAAAKQNWGRLDEENTSTSTK